MRVSHPELHAHTRKEKKRPPTSRSPLSGSSLLLLRSKASEQRHHWLNRGGRAWGGVRSPTKFQAPPCPRPYTCCTIPLRMFWEDLVLVCISKAAGLHWASNLWGTAWNSGLFPDCTTEQHIAILLPVAGRIWLFRAGYCAFCRGKDFFHWLLHSHMR